MLFLYLLLYLYSQLIYYQLFNISSILTSSIITKGQTFLYPTTITEWIWEVFTHKSRPSLIVCFSRILWKKSLNSNIYLTCLKGIYSIVYGWQWFYIECINAMASDDFIMNALIITLSLVSRHGCTSLMHTNNPSGSR